MIVTVKTEHDCAKKVVLDCSPVEWLIINKALKQFYQNILDTNHLHDVNVAESMLEVEPIFVEEGEE